MNAASTVEAEGAPRRLFRQAAPVCFALGMAALLVAACGVRRDRESRAPARPPRRPRRHGGQTTKKRDGACGRRELRPMRANPRSAEHARSGGFDFNHGLVNGVKGVDPNSPQYVSANKAREHLLPNAARQLLGKLSSSSPRRLGTYSAYVRTACRMCLTRQTRMAMWAFRSAGPA